MTEQSGRVNAPISTSELERRWSAIRAAMTNRGIDVLVTQNNSPDWGYVRYFTDLPQGLPQGGYGSVLIFPLDGPMTLVRSGPFDGDRDVDPRGEGMMRGIERVLTAPFFPGVHFTQHLDAELAVTALAPYARSTVGLVGANHMVFPVVDILHRELSRATFVDATDLVDSIKIIKSKEEEMWIRRTAHIQDAAMQVALEAIKPGVRDIDVDVAIEAFSLREGCEYGLYRVGSSPLSDPAPVAQPKHAQQRVIERGDIVMILLESSGPGGFFCELGRQIVVGQPPPARLVDELEFLSAAQQLTVDLMRPGASCAGIFEQFNDFMIENGRPRERRVHAHGQGYDLVERPLIRSDESAVIEVGMSIACHPSNVISAMDNYFVTDSGVEKLHEFPQEILQV